MGSDPESAAKWQGDKNRTESVRNKVGSSPVRIPGGEQESIDKECRRHKPRGPITYDLVQVTMAALGSWPEQPCPTQRLSSCYAFPLSGIPIRMALLRCDASWASEGVVAMSRTGPSSALGPVRRPCINWEDFRLSEIDCNILEF